jgi:hypothetical protein
MTVRRTFCLVTACLAVLGVLVLPACGDRDGAPLPAETDEPFYVQGKTLVRQGRHPEALTSFLKVIERRGERGAAESHLEAGSIYLYYTKDPVEAYHHFRRYLALQPNSKEAAGVRGKVEEAKREFARTLPARPLEDQSLRMQADDAFAKLQREVEELRAQNATCSRGNLRRPCPVSWIRRRSRSRPRPARRPRRETRCRLPSTLSPPRNDRRQRRPGRPIPLRARTPSHRRRRCTGSRLSIMATAGRWMRFTRRIAIRCGAGRTSVRA